MQDKISLAGDLGSGKSTVSKLLIDSLGMEYYSTGTICRAVAAKHGMTVVEMNVYMETHPELDREIDDGLVALSDVDKPLLIDSRMAWHFVRGTFRVYLSTEVAVSAARIFGAGRAEEQFASVEETEAKIRERRDSEKKRFLEFYGVNNKDLFNYDLILDTTYAAPDEIAARISTAFRAWQEDKSRRFCYLSPLRLYYRDDLTASEGEVASLSAEIDAGARPVLDVAIDGERFLAVGNAALPLAYALSDMPFIPCRLVKDADTSGDWVRMADSL